MALIVQGLPKFKGLFLIGFFLPYLASGVVSSLIVKGILSYNSPLNEFLRGSFGLDINWLGTPFAALFVVAMIIAWKFTGYYALILTSGFESIDKEVYEAAMIDGVTRLAAFLENYFSASVSGFVYGINFINRCYVWYFHRGVPINRWRTKFCNQYMADGDFYKSVLKSSSGLCFSDCHYCFSSNVYFNFYHSKTLRNVGETKWVDLRKMDYCFVT